MSREFNQCVSALTEKIVESYNHDETYTTLVSATLPNRNEVIKIINDIRELFYPRHYGGREVYNCTMQYFIGDLLMRIEERLHRQVRLALMRKYENTVKHHVQNVADEAAQISCAFMETLPKIREYMVMDIQAAYDGDPAAADKDQIIFSYPGVFAIMVYRIAHELSLLNVPIIPRMMTEYAHSRTGIDINPGATIGKYFFMDHGTGIVIGETTLIGDYVKLYQGVTLGALSTRGGQNLRGKKRHPTIENNVTIYSNVSILGGDTVIGHDAVIGGNCFITCSVPAGSKVSVKNPELQFESGRTEEIEEDFKW